MPEVQLLETYKASSQAAGDVTTYTCRTWEAGGVYNGTSLEGHPKIRTPKNKDT